MEDQKIEIDKKVLKSITDITEELFSLLGIKAGLTITHDKENDCVMIDIEAPDSAGLIIGRRGETIAAVQTILGMMVRQNLGGWVRVVLNLGDYREKQEDQLKELALQSAERARETGVPQSLYNLNPSQRRIIHMVLSEEKDLVTESEGEGRDRHLVVSAKK